jgi:GTP cyclohydrolase I
LERRKKIWTERTSTKPTFYGEKIGNNEWIEFPDEHGTTIEENIRRILQYIGEDPNREGLKDTPDRIVRMCKEIFRGYDMSQKPKITTFRNGVDGIVYDNMVVDKGDYYSLCEHHMRTFFGEYYFAYIPHPKGKILGISKIGRVVDFCASKLQIQERLVYEVIQMLTEALDDKHKPLGMALVMKGRHMCKESRGARKKGVMISSCLTGVFKTEPALRAEFLAMCE